MLQISNATRVPPPAIRTLKAARDRVARLTMLRLVAGRLLQGIPVMIGVSFLAFALMNLLPGGTANALAGPEASKAQVHALAVRLHLDQPFFTRYWHWLTAAVTGHLGNSLANGQSVASILVNKVPVTAEIVFVALILSVILAIPVAVLSVYRVHGLIDRMTIMLTISGLAIPGFVLGIVLILVFAVQLRWLPPIGYTPLSQGVWPNLRTVILPCSALAIPLFCHYTRVLRADLLDQMNAEGYVTTAVAKGLAPIRVLVRHALRNSMFNLFTLIGLNIGVLIGGTVLIEQIFAIPGIGKEMIVSVQLQDVTVVEGVVVVLALTVVLASILTDLVYSALDPRIRHGHSRV